MGKVGEIFIVLDTKLDRFNKGMSDAERAMVRVGTKFTAIGKKLSMMVTLPILAVGVGAVKAFADFDKAMTESLAIMGPISDSMRQKMADVAKTISEETTFAASELAESYYYLASAGMTAEQSVAALDKVAKFAQAGAFDLATATDLLTDAQTAMGLSSKDAVKNQENLVKVSDVLVGANTLANASVQQFSESLTNMAAAALTNVNKGLEEGVAILAAFADKGIKGQKAGMKLSMMLNALDKAASKNKEAWKKYNIQLWDAEGNMRNVGDIIGDLETAFKHLTPEAKAAALAELGFDTRVKNSILSLMGSSEKILQWTEDLKHMGGITEEVAGKQMEAFSNQLKVVKNMLVNVGAEIGEILVPVLKNLIDNHIKPAIEWFKGLTDAQKETIVRVAGLAAALGPLLWGFGKLLTIIPKINMALKLLAASPMGLIITGLVVIAEKTRQAINTFKDFSESLNEYLDASGKKMGWLEKTWEGVTATIHKHVYGVDAAKFATKKYAEMTEEARKKQAELAKTTLDAIKKTGLHTKAIDSLKNAFGFLIPKIKETEDAEKGLGGETDDLDNKITKIIPKIKDERTEVEKLTSKYWDLMANVFKGEAGWQTFINQAVELKDKIKDLEEGLGELDMAIDDDAEAWIDMGDKVNTVMEDMGYGIKNIPDETKKSLAEAEDVWESFADGLRTKWVSAISDMIFTAKSFSEAFKGIGEAMLKQAIDMFSVMVMKAKTSAAAMKAAFVSFAVYVGTNLLDHLLKAFGIIKDEIEEIVGGLDTISKSQLTAPSKEKREENKEKFKGLDEFEKAMVDLRKIMETIKDITSLTTDEQESLNEKWAEAIKYAIEYGQEGTKAFVDQIKKMREMGLESKALSDYIWGQLSAIPEALSVMINNIPDFQRIKDRIAKKKLRLEDIVDPEMRKELMQQISELEDRLARGAEWAGKSLNNTSKIVQASWQAMIAEGKGYMEVLDAMKEPLETLRQRYKDLGQDVPAFLAPMFDILEKMEIAPKVFENLDASRTILESLTNTAYLTQDAFDALSKSAGAFARTMLDVTGNLNDFMLTSEMTNDQIQQLLPVVSQFVGAAAAFGLGVPAWMKTFVTEHLGVDWGEFKKTAAAQANAGLETVKKLDRVDQRIKRQTEVIQNKFDKLGETLYKHLSTVMGRVTGRLDKINTSISNIGGFASGGIAWTPQLAMVAENGPELITPLSDLNQVDTGGVDSMNVAIEIQPIVIPRGDEYVIEFLQKSIKRGNIKIPITAVGA